MANKRILPIDMSFIDRQGKVVKPNKKDFDAKRSQKAGEAYAFFNCSASYEQISAEIPTIRDLGKTPSELELHLIEGPEGIQGDSQILEIAREAKDAELNYAIQARYPSATNEQTADELVTVLNQVYQSPLYQEGEKFRGGIFHKQNGKYLSRD